VLLGFRLFCRLAAHLDKIEFDVSLVTTEWFLCLFAKSLPSEVQTYEKKYTFGNWYSTLSTRCKLGTFLLFGFVSYISDS